MHKERMDRVMDSLAREGLDQVLITDPLSIYYLTGYLVEPFERLFALCLKRVGDSLSRRSSQTSSSPTLKALRTRSCVSPTPTT